MRRLINIKLFTLGAFNIINGSFLKLNANPYGEYVILCGMIFMGFFWYRIIKEKNKK